MRRDTNYFAGVGRDESAVFEAGELARQAAGTRTGTPLEARKGRIIKRDWYKFNNPTFKIRTFQLFSTQAGLQDRRLAHGQVTPSFTCTGVPSLREPSRSGHLS
jgi:hypothetical protein